MGRPVIRTDDSGWTWQQILMRRKSRAVLAIFHLPKVPRFIPPDGQTVLSAERGQAAAAPVY